ncbi:MAG: ComF family protein [Cyanobacteria bacterium P01_G01_bin.39]
MHDPIKITVNCYEAMLEQFLSVFLKPSCVFCQRTASDTICQYCLQKLSSHQLNNQERLKLQQAESVFAWGKYDGQLKRAIALMKYNNKPVIGNVIGKLLAQAWLNHDLAQQKVTVIPIPLHRQKLKERGFNQAEIIARGFCQLTGYKLNTEALVRTRNTKAMFDLKTIAERANNLQGAFSIGHKLPRSSVLIIDDIYTTGTTAQESIRVLQNNQIKVISVAVAAVAGQ